MLPATFRDKLLQVQEDLTSSLRTLVLSNDTSSSLVASSKQVRNLDDVPLDAGADLLNHYQYHWCRMREASERCYRMAQESDRAIELIANYISQQHTLVANLTLGLSSVCMMTEQLQKLNQTLNHTEKLVNDTEIQLATLEDLLEDVEFEKRMKEYELKTEMLNKQKMADLEQLKRQLAMEHAMKIKEYEVKQMIKAKERQAVFEQVFEADIQQYKASGILPKSNLPRSGTTSLEEIVVEDDVSALDQFLNE